MSWPSKRSHAPEVKIPVKQLNSSDTAKGSGWARNKQSCLMTEIFSGDPKINKSGKQLKNQKSGKTVR